ncbi:MAG: glycosyltransferase family 4 protein [Phycisphaerae bacterium]|nr:glycosyltransferase family 4 protein [Phycisphaerae bacterium]
MSKRIMICIPCLRVGGTELHTLELASALVRGGYEVTVCAYYEHDDLMAEQIRRTGARLLLLGLSRNRDDMNLWRMPKLLRSLVGTFVRERPHIVHAQYMAPGLAPILAARLRGVPHVCATIHVPGRAYGKRIWLPRLATRLCDAMICVSQAAERSFFGTSALFSEEGLMSGLRHFTIPNGVDVAMADRILASGRSDDLRSRAGQAGAPTVAVVGRLSQEKGHRWLIDSMRRVALRWPSVRLLVVGDGPEKDSVRKRAIDQGIERNVHWVGNVSHEEALAWCGAADVVAAPSQWEGFGLAAAEAMAMGRAVVATSTDGLAEVVQDGVTGLLVPYGDVRGMAHAIEALLSDPHRRREMGRRGRRRTRRLFSREVFARRHLLLYRALASEAAGRHRHRLIREIHPRTTAC